MVLMFIQEIRTLQQRRNHAVFQNPGINTAQNPRNCKTAFSVMSS